MLHYEVNVVFGAGAFDFHTERTFLVATQSMAHLGTAEVVVQRILSEMTGSLGPVDQFPMPGRLARHFESLVIRVHNRAGFKPSQNSVELSHVTEAWEESEALRVRAECELYDRDITARLAALKELSPPMPGTMGFKSHYEGQSDDDDGEEDVDNGEDRSGPRRRLPKKPARSKVTRVEFKPGSCGYRLEVKTTPFLSNSVIVV